ncbi:MAG TPA: DUF1360 domain-containing protein [Gaiellaceae bacterium]|nr:DUF1360 domain-containing protein [Gaiellaceae bacterium]
MSGDRAFGIRFALASLAVWRVTHVLVEEDGPAELVVRLRARLGQGRLSELMDCFYCLSAWVAAPASLLVARRRRELPLIALALSAAACLLERATRERAQPYVETVEWKGADDELLWREAESTERQSEPAHTR